MADLSLDVGAGTHAREKWEAAAAAVLRKTGKLTDSDPDSEVWTRLTRRTLDDVAIAPLGTADTVAGLPGAGLPGQVPYVRGTAAARHAGGWDVRALFEDDDATLTSGTVLTDLENGATSLWLRVGLGGLRAADLPAVLERVYLDLAPVVLESADDPLGAAEALCAVLEDRGLDAAPGTNLGADPLGTTLRGDADAPDVAATTAAVADLARRHGLRALVVDATAAHDHGASDVQELGWSLAAGAAYLRLLTEHGVPVDEAAALIEFRYAATDEQFVTIAKLRAARRVWHRLTELSGVSPASRGQVQHAVTSRPMMSAYDPYVNMLRTTVAAFAAGVGGATAVTVLPFDAPLGLPDAFSRRIARNTSSLLVAESHVGAVTDPAGGSYAVEQLTDDLARAGWDELRRIEANGGAAAACAALREAYAETATRRTAQVATRERPLTGLTEFPDLHQTQPERRPYPEGSPQVERYGAAFEALRDDRAATPVFLATMGTIADHTARATFAANLFATGGVDTVVAGPTADIADVLAAYGEEPVVCLAGTDGAYAEWGRELADALHEAGARRVVVAGKPMDGVDDSAVVGVDALAFLTRTRAHLEESA